MVRAFDTERAGELVATARRDRGMSQAALAELAGMSQPNVAAIESGRRAIGPEVLERLLRAADYRPSLPLEAAAEAVVAAGQRRGLTDIRVFGSVADGTDHFASDIDLLVTVAPGRSYLDIAMFQNDVEDLTRFPVDVVVDGPGRPDFLDQAPTLAL